MDAHQAMEEPPRKLGRVHASPWTALYVGRLRRWRQDWGFIYSEVHRQDILLVASSCDEDCRSLQEGDFLLFKVLRDQHGLLEARSARRAEPIEIDQQQELYQEVEIQRILFGD